MAARKMQRRVASTPRVWHWRCPDFESGGSVGMQNFLHEKSRFHRCPASQGECYGGGRVAWASRRRVRARKGPSNDSRNSWRIWPPLERRMEKWFGDCRMQSSWRSLWQKRRREAKCLLDSLPRCEILNQISGGGLLVTKIHSFNYKYSKRRSWWRIELRWRDPIASNQISWV